jgi:hypothetical protein
MAAEQDNAAVVRRFWDLVWNNGELPAIDELVDDDFTNFGIRRPGGHAALRSPTCLSRSKRRSPAVTPWRTGGARHAPGGVPAGDRARPGPGRDAASRPVLRSRPDAHSPGPRRQDHRSRRDPQRSAHAQPARPAARHRAGQRGILAYPADPRFPAVRLSQHGPAWLLVRWPGAGLTSGSSGPCRSSGGGRCRDLADAHLRVGQARSAQAVLEPAPAAVS